MFSTFASALSLCTDRCRKQYWFTYFYLIISCCRSTIKMNCVNLPCYSFYFAIASIADWKIQVNKFVPERYAYLKALIVQSVKCEISLDSWAFEICINWKVELKKALLIDYAQYTLLYIFHTIITIAFIPSRPRAPKCYGAFLAVAI